MFGDRIQQYFHLLSCCNALSGTFDTGELMGCSGIERLGRGNGELASVTSRVHEGEISLCRDLQIPLRHTLAREESGRSSSCFNSFPSL